MGRLSNWASGSGMPGRSQPFWNADTAARFGKPCVRSRLMADTRSTDPCRVHAGGLALRGAHSGTVPTRRTRRSMRTSSWRLTIAVKQQESRPVGVMIARPSHGGARAVTRITIRRAFGRDSAGDLAEPTSGGSAATNGRGRGAVANT